MEKRRIITAYGLSTEENIFIKECFAPDKYEYRDYSEHCETDLIAHSSTVLILNSQKLSEDGRAMIWDYYREAGDTTDEIIIWLGNRFHQIIIVNHSSALKALINCGMI